MTSENLIGWTSRPIKWDFHLPLSNGVASSPNRATKGRTRNESALMRCWGKMTTDCLEHPGTIGNPWIFMDINPLMIIFLWFSHGFPMKHGYFSCKNSRCPIFNGLQVGLCELGKHQLKVMNRMRLWIGYSTKSTLGIITHGNCYKSLQIKRGFRIFGKINHIHKIH